MAFERKKTFDQKIDEAPLPTRLTKKERGKRRRPKKLTMWQKIIEYLKNLL